MLSALNMLLFRLIYGKEGDTMIAMLWAQRIMNGKKTYDQVPRLLKEQVKEILIESGVEFLITEEKTPTV
jgi:hypothetical protein